jgi:hypothetical protein
MDKEQSLLQPSRDIQRNNNTTTRVFGISTTNSNDKNEK